ncbi:HalOD1 output domain-containing protein [Salinigranum marinum]|uniref:HalOD1 output domain-containing protein n=1 Tax=Salinigranum marinum TaxID=1515595 RepID=UPI002989C40D|nr:HalOD1 output domain-containing protein [Salinigranum marinum]
MTGKPYHDSEFVPGSERDQPGPRAAGTLAFRITEAVAVEYGTEATEIKTRLWDAIEVDALSGLFGRSQQGAVRFTFAGCHVEINFLPDGTEEITVRRI